MRVVVLTTSYPRSADESAGVFIREAVDALRAAGVEVEVVSPASVPHYGIAYGHGIAGNLRRRPWKALLLPVFVLRLVVAARRAARGADLVHVHWLPTAVAGLLTGKPLVVQAWGTDVELARRAPWLFRPLLRRARVLLAASEALARELRAIGAEGVRVVPSGVEVPAAVGAPDEPPHVLFAGRLSEEKGILELVEAAQGLPLVVAGDGPLRERVPDALGWVAHDELLRLYERAAVVACPSHREGYGIACAEAMAHGRPVVGSDVAGIAELIVDGETGYLVPPGDVQALRHALERLLADSGLRERLGRAGRVRIREHFSWERAVAETVLAYENALFTKLG